MRAGMEGEDGGPTLAVLFLLSHIAAVRDGRREVRLQPALS